MSENYRKSIASLNNFPQFTTMNVIDGQAGIIICSSLIFYSLTIDNILNIVVLLILAAVTINTLTGENGILTKANQAKDQTEIARIKEEADLVKIGLNMDYLVSRNDSERLKKNILLSALNDHFVDSTLQINRIVTSDGKYDVIVRNNLDIIVVKHGGEYLEEREIELSYYYDETETDGNVIVEIYPEVGGFKTYQEYAEEILAEITDDTDDAEKGKLFVEANKYNMFGNEIPSEVENITEFADWMNYCATQGAFEGEKEIPTTIEEFRVWFNGKQGVEVFATVDELLIGWKYVKPAEYEEKYGSGEITIECSNGQTATTNIEELYAEFTIEESGTYTFAATSTNGATGELIIKIDNIVDKSGANAPELKDGIQAITFASDGTETVVTDTSKKDWYNYRVTEDSNMTDGGTTNGGNSKWANAKLNGNYYVWIPRYAYKIDTSVIYTGQSATSNKIDVKFIGTDVTQENIASKLGASYADYIVHPAFTFGTKELSGFWVGKYETTGTTDTPTIKPNETSLRSINVSTMFSTAQKSSTNNYDAHMMKNIEWGAVAYLAQSPYGRNGTEISVNQCSGYITGAGKTTGSNEIYETSYYSTPTAEQQYNGTIGKLSSTTGNIYGVYDMSGGACECVMGFYGTDGNPTVGSTGFTLITFPENKYYDLYTSTSADSSNIGDALYETQGWNSDGPYFVNSTNPVFHRGGGYFSTFFAGAFCFGVNDGNGYDSDSYAFRMCLAVK